MKPKKGLQKIKDQEEVDKLKAYKDSLSEEVKKLVEETKQLKASKKKHLQKKN